MKILTSYLTSEGADISVEGVAKHLVDKMLAGSAWEYRYILWWICDTLENADPFSDYYEAIERTDWFIEWVREYDYCTENSVFDIKNIEHATEAKSKLFFAMKDVVEQYKKQTFQYEEP